LATTYLRIAARELPPRSLSAFKAALIISAYFGCDAECFDLLFAPAAFFLLAALLGDAALALVFCGAEAETGADEPSVIVFDLFFVLILNGDGSS
jgi:hypothetical protein